MEVNPFVMEMFTLNNRLVFCQYYFYSDIQWFAETDYSLCQPIQKIKNPSAIFDLLFTNMG